MAAGIPEIVGAYLPSLTQNGDKSIFRNVASDAQLATIMAQFIKSKGYTRIAILAGTAAFSAGEGVAMNSALTAIGLAPVADISYTDGATDFSGQIEALKAAESRMRSSLLHMTLMGLKPVPR